MQQNDTINLQGKTAFVTGAGRGIGREIVLKLASRGAHTVIADLNGDNAASVAEEIKRAGGSASSVQLDVTRLDEVQAAFDGVVKDQGRLDILVNDAAVWFPKFFLQSTPEEWHTEMNVCFFGVVHTTRAALPHMVERNYGRIVNIASGAGRVGEKRQAVYSGAKGAVIAFSKAISREYSRNNITVNCVAPGMTLSSPQMAAMMTGERAAELKTFYPLFRGEGHPPLGQPTDIAAAVAFLASDDASWVTGQTLSVDGGYSMI